MDNFSRGGFKYILKYILRQIKPLKVIHILSTFQDFKNVDNFLKVLDKIGKNLLKNFIK